MWNYIRKILAIPLIVSFLIPWGVVASSNTLGFFEAVDSGGGISSQANVIVSPFTTGAITGTVKSGRFYTKVSSGSAATALVIYSSSGGSPNTLLATSNEVTVSSTTITTINYTFSGVNQINLLPNTTYFIGVHHADPGTPNIYEAVNSNSTASNCAYWNFNDTYPGAESTFTVDDSFCFAEFNVDISFDSPDGVSFPLISSHLYDSGLRMDFDGVDERLTSTSNPSFSSDTKSGGRTVCQRFNMDTSPASETSFSLLTWSNSDAQGVWNIRVRNGRSSVPWTGVRWELQTALDTGAGTGLSTLIYSSAQTFSTGTEYQWCLVSSGTAWTLYVNGSSTTLTVSTTGSGGNDGDWWGDVLGSGTITFTAGATVAGAAPLDGKIDEIEYFDDDLTSAEITALYNNGKPIHPLAIGLTDLSGYWKLGESEGGSVSTIYDSKGVMTDTWTGTNMENSDIIPTNYY